MRNIPEDNLAYPVLLKWDTGITGSSFFLRADNKMFLVTAKHVLFDKEDLRGKKIELVCQTRALKDENINKYLIDLTKSKVLKHETADIGAIEIGEIIEIQDDGGRLFKFNEGISVIHEVASGIVSASAGDATKLLKDVLISNDVILYGYPTSLGLRNSPQFDYNKPLLRKGIIANIYQDGGTIILDCPVYYGNSGGPVVEVEQDGLTWNHKIIGVVSQFIPFCEHWENKENGLVNTELSNSGYSVAVAMDKVFELIGYKTE